jgi:hypothetical protein
MSQKYSFALLVILIVLASAEDVHQVADNSSCTQDCCKSLAARPAQTYTFYQKTGRFRGGSGPWAIDVHGYSGQGSGYLNPDAQCIVNTGPLPANTYKLTYCQNIMHTTVQRPCSFVLTPQDESKMCGRNDFLVHGCDCCTPGDSTVPPVIHYIDLERRLFCRLRCHQLPESAKAANRRYSHCTALRASRIGRTCCLIVYI